MPANPDSINVRFVQVDAPVDKPWDEPINVETDGFKVAAVFLVEPTNNDKLVALWRDGDDLRVRDVSNPGVSSEGYTLSELLAGVAGLTKSEHRTLRQLIHFIDDGPAEGFATGAFREVLPTGDPFPTSAIWWESSSKLKKIVEVTVTYSGPFPATEEWKMYDTDGSTVLATVTDTIVYSGPFESNRTRAIVIP
jgi:hypothetical protein